MSSKMPKSRKPLPVSKNQPYSQKKSRKKKPQNNQYRILLGFVTIVRKKKRTWIGIDNFFLYCVVDRLVDLFFFTSLVFHS